ncbi:MAG: hypothetical protein ACRDKJ_00860 [Actinomycetota bacterium]
MRRRDVRRHLEVLGHQTPPAPDTELVEGLAARLRMAGPSSGRGGVSPLRRRSLRRAVAVAAVGVVAAGFLMIGGATDPLTLTSSTDSVVTLPDGSVFTDPEGLALPDGTVIRTGPSGRVEAGDDVLGPDREARVRDGRIVGERTRTRPTPTPRPRSTPQASPVATGEPRPVQSPVPTTRPGPPAIDLACRASDRGGVICRWSPVDDARFARYVLLRNDGTGDREVFGTRDRSHVSFTDKQVRSGASYSYTVLVYDTRGEPFGSGGPVRVTAA